MKSTNKEEGWMWEEAEELAEMCDEEDVCPTCGQNLWGMPLDEHKAKAATHARERGEQIIGTF